MTHSLALQNQSDVYKVLKFLRYDIVTFHVSTDQFATICCGHQKYFSCVTSFPIASSSAVSKIRFA